MFDTQTLAQLAVAWFAISFAAGGLFVLVFYKRGARS